MSKLREIIDRYRFRYDMQDEVFDALLRGMESYISRATIEEESAIFIAKNGIPRKAIYIERPKIKRGRPSKATKEYLGLMEMFPKTWIEMRSGITYPAEIGFFTGLWKLTNYYVGKRTIIFPSSTFKTKKGSGFYEFIRNCPLQEIENPEMIYLANLRRYNWSLKRHIEGE